MTDEQRTRIAKKVAIAIAEDLSDMLVDMFQLKLDDHFNDLVEDLSETHIKQQWNAQAYEEANESGELSDIIVEVNDYLKLTYPKVVARCRKQK